MTDAERTYIYALVRPAPGEISATGIDAGPVRIVPVGEVGAVVSTVPAELFASETVEERMRDLTWVESVARAHDHVVGCAAQLTTTIPLRFGTIAANDDSVQELLADLSAAVQRTFDRIAGCVEFGVQVFARAPRSHERAAVSEGGAAFLRRRQAELQHDDALRTMAGEEAETIYLALARLATESRRNPVRDDAPSSVGAMMLNGAFLVDNTARDSFRSAAAELSASLGPDRVIVTGPWAPYSFTELQL
jgi:hypothetical protein